MNAMNPEFIKRSRRKARGSLPDPFVGVRMPVELVAALKEEAARRGVKQAVIIREGLVKLLAQREAEQHFNSDIAA